MAKTRIEWVTELPEERLPSTIYLLRSETNDLAEIYLTNNEGTALRHVLNKADVQGMITSALEGHSELLVVNNIEERDALVLTRNTQVMVLDATGDTTVSSGAATYIFRKETDDFVKISEFESMDITPHWGDLVGKPVSSAEDIDDAVTKRHTHSNLDTLEKLSEVDGALTFGGQPLVVMAVDQQW